MNLHDFLCFGENVQKRICPNPSWDDSAVTVEYFWSVWTLSCAVHGVSLNTGDDLWHVFSADTYVNIIIPWDEHTPMANNAEQCATSYKVIHA